ncbi:MAG TPA: hypothetical protein VGJ84_16805 [Polyangiaceae bacterium]
MSRVRELAPKGPVRGRLISRKEIVEYVRKELKTHVPANTLRASQHLLYCLNLVDASFDYEASLVKLLGSQLAGFYDTREKTMFLAVDLAADERRITLSHELVHALQDQHYDLDELTRSRPDSSDRDSAIQALAEGDATSAMLEAMLEGSHRSALDMPEDVLRVGMRSFIELSPDTADVPSIVKRSLVAPYVDGIEFVHFLRRRSGWSGVDAAWRHPPVSTEQVLHPDRFLAGENPEPIAIPKNSLVGRSEPEYHDILGEQTLRILFEEWMPEGTASEASTGWAGDRVAVFSEDRRYVTAWHVRYDSRASAKRALIGFARGILRPELAGSGSASAPFVTLHTAQSAVAADQVCQERKERGPFAAARRGRDLGIIAGPTGSSSGDARGKSGSPGCPGALKWAEALSQQQTGP